MEEKDTQLFPNMSKEENKTIRFLADYFFVISMADAFCADSNHPSELGSRIYDGFVSYIRESTGITSAQIKLAFVLGTAKALRVVDNTNKAKDSESVETAMKYFKEATELMHSKFEKEEICENKKDIAAKFTGLFGNPKLSDDDLVN